MLHREYTELFEYINREMNALIDMHKEGILFSQDIDKTRYKINKKITAIRFKEKSSKK